MNTTSEPVPDPIRVRLALALATGTPAAAVGLIDLVCRLYQGG